VSASPSSSERFPQIEKYELLEEIGHGGMATVYRARDLRLEREVAVKVIHKHLRENPEVRRRFVSEAKAVAKLRHEGIVEVYDVSDEEHVERFLVVELIRGSSLRQVLQKHGVLPAEIAAIVVSHLCDAVEHAHQSGVIHRDIKPENVMVELPSPTRSSENGPEPPAGSSEPPRASSERSRRGVAIKLTDFGIAKVLDAQGVTSTGQILGSPAHMAPEQIEGGDIGPHTDVFALGVLFYECMVGHLPFEGKNPAQVLRRVLEGSFEPADAEHPEVGGRWSAIVADALATNIVARTPSAAALGARIDAELAALGIEDPKAELFGFFAEPATHARGLRGRLVPRLLERGENERRAGRVPLAAADFNRALALDPDDLSILRRVSSLSARAAWRERAFRGAAVVAGSLVLGGSAYGVTRWVKTTPVTVSPEVSFRDAAPAPPPMPTTTDVVPAPTGEPKVETSATAEAAEPEVAEVAERPSLTKLPPPSDEAPKKPTARRVRFHVNPGGAKLEVDGAPVAWYRTTPELSIGPHTVRVWADGGCCKETETSFQVLPPPDDDPEAVQTQSFFLEIHPARFRLSGSPPGATVICRGVTATAGSTGEMAMSRTLEWSGPCVFMDGSGQQLEASVKLKAGETTSIPWPAPR
jgi:eukaryotic-like serine/threonine-protein kinase